MYTQLTVIGNDASEFLQGQLTQDLANLSASHSPLAAWCTPRGRVVAVMRLVADDAGIGLILPAAIATEVRAGLERYRMRSKVQFADAASDWQAFAVANDTDLALLAGHDLLPADERDASCRANGIVTVRVGGEQPLVEVYGTTKSLQPKQPLSNSKWQAARIRAGIADIGVEGSGKYTPHMLNLDRLGAISFDKGCYTGQEIVARTQNLGNAPRRIAAFSSDRPLAVGDRIDLDGTSVGDVVAAAEDHALVLLPVDLHGQTLSAGDATLRPLA